MMLLEEAHIFHSIQLNAMKPNKCIGHHQVQSTVLGCQRHLRKDYEGHALQNLTIEKIATLPVAVKLYTFKHT